MGLNFERIADTANGALNKHLIDNFIVTRRIDGSELSEKQIMQLTRPYFKMAEYTEDSDQQKDVELRWEETPIQKQFSVIKKMAVESSNEAEAARCYVDSIYPMCNACTENSDGINMSLYNAEQMVTAFISGQQWLRTRVARLIPLDTITLEGGFRLLNDFIRAIPKNWTIEQAIEYIKHQK